MSELAKGPKTHLVSGTQGPGVQCKHCGYGIPIGGDLRTLPASFEARCATCKKLATYEPREILTLVVAVKH
jgi:hypothetical protein